MTDDTCITPDKRCPIAASLDVLGDRWTLVVVRDLLLGRKRRFSEFMASAEGITTNILADRLKRLTDHGVVDRVRYSARPPRYEYVLTDKGRDLFEVLAALVKWGGRHIPETVPLSRETLRSRLSPEDDADIG